MQKEQKRTAKYNKRSADVPEKNVDLDEDESIETEYKVKVVDES